jgi:hypothetical protein
LEHFIDIDPADRQRRAPLKQFKGFGKPDSQKKTPRERGADSSQDLGR